MNSCISLLFMILSNGCVDNKKGEIRRKLVFSCLYELRSCSFNAKLKKESNWKVLFVVCLEEHLSILKRVWS